ncbi:uncharacterized protein N7479_006030 [Penicillium vulpinum]|uniref:Protein FAF1 n=1 Tax=Penicillium vulpinum TaxID=29845 RepID=A0A1V6SF43_9EURO|nr:uncharacterized protein N7479_006030 [Penicillium vulpinum]KAJ5958880.1 hypothetical protein N7479_006030 [Penicillium vulpinum]OQE12379.1 hypothetical protein PENVUL_c001G10169 [Penicillium vulpinum]
MIVKRKRETTVASKPKTKEDSPPPVDNAQDVFRRLFEAQFEPLDLPAPTAKSTNSNEEEDEDEDDDSDMSGSEGDWDEMSDISDESNQVEVVEHTGAYMAPEDRMDKKTWKAFMSGKVLSDLDKPSTEPEPTSKKEEEEDAHDSANLKHDLALQRLLKESHLLDSADDLAPTGKNRLKALDLRMQSLGAKTSLYAQNKMPTAHRRGIKAKAESKEGRRRQEAKENGIILEKPTKVHKSSNNGRRERGVSGASVGKFSGGTLNLNKDDIARVQASGRRMMGGRGKGKTRGGRGGRGGGGRGGGRGDKR